MLEDKKPNMTTVNTFHSAPDFNVEGKGTKMECHTILTISPTALFLKKKKALSLFPSYPRFCFCSHRCSCSVTCEEQLLFLSGAETFEYIVIARACFVQQNAKTSRKRSFQLVRSSGTGVVIPVPLDVMGLSANTVHFYWRNSPYCQRLCIFHMFNMFKGSVFTLRWSKRRLF